MKARQFSAYSPAYSPSSGISKDVVGSSVGGGGSTIEHGGLPIQSPLYVPPSMGGHGSGSSGASSKVAVVQSP